MKGLILTLLILFALFFLVAFVPPEISDQDIYTILKKEILVEPPH